MTSVSVAIKSFSLRLFKQAPPTASSHTKTIPSLGMICFSQPKFIPRPIYGWSNRLIVRQSKHSQVFAFWSMAACDERLQNLTATWFCFHLRRMEYAGKVWLKCVFADSLSYWVACIVFVSTRNKLCGSSAELTAPWVCRGDCCVLSSIEWTMYSHEPFSRISLLIQFIWRMCVFISNFNHF